MEEIWKKYIRVRGNGVGTVVTDVEISNFGNVRAIDSTSKWNLQPFNENLITIRRDRKCIVTVPIYSLVWKLFNGEVPKGYVIHHKDHNKLNDRLDNLELMTVEEHNKHHHTGLKHSKETKKHMSEIKAGKTHAPLSEETKQKISASLKGQRIALGMKFYNDGIKNSRFKSEVEAFANGYFYKGRISKNQNNVAE